MIGGAASLVLAALPAMAAPADGWDGDFADGLARIRSLAEEARYEEALEVAAAMLEPGAFRRADREGSGILRRAANALERPLAWIGVETIGPRERAEVRYAEGLVAWRAGDEARAEEAFESARAEAGPGQTRSGSIYALGTLELARAERLRAEIPEIAGASPAPAPPPASAGSAASDGEEADPLDLAREAYLAARERFVEGLRIDWRHADTRANTELVLRRLRELDEIERERERQEEQRRQQQQQQQPSEPQDSEDGGEPAPDEPGDSSERPQDESDPDTAPDEGEPTDEPSEEEPDPSEETGEDERPEGEEEPAAAEPDSSREPEERVLTEEEVKRLLERLDELVEKGEEVRARLERRRRVPVERDW